MKIELRPYQQRDCAQLLAGLARGESIVRQLPTGGGKGVEIAYVISETIRHGFEWNVVTHRQEIRHQISKHLTAMGIPHGQIAPGQELTSHPVHIASVDTLSARLSSMAPWLRRTRALVDECHHSVSTTWDGVLSLAPQRAGFTATPGRLDGTGLGDTGLYSRMIQGPSIRMLTEMGYLAPARVYSPPTSVDWSLAAGRGSDFTLRKISEILKSSPELTNMALLWYAHHCPGQPAVVFCTDLEHAEEVAARFGKAGWRAQSVDGTMSNADRDAAITGLRDGAIQILTSCELIGEGTDIPAVSAMIDLRPTMSTTLFLQHVGRCLRLHADKTCATVLDLVGNSARHGFYAAERQWSLLGGLQGTDLVISGTWRCTNCHQVHEKFGDEPQSCDCGSRAKFVSARIDGHPPIAGISAVKLSEMRFMDAQALMRTRADLVQFGKLRGLEKPVTYANQILAQREKRMAAAQ